MKKLLLLMCVLLTGVSGAWATDITVNSDNGTFSRADNRTDTDYRDVWTSTSTTPTIVVNCLSAGRILPGQDYGDGYWSGTYKITVPAGYVVTGYSITGEGTTANSGETITPKDGDGNAVNFAKDTENTITVSGLYKRVAYFALTGSNQIKVSSFTVSYAEETTYTWSSGVGSSEVGGSGNYYSTCWYLKLTTPNYDDVFFDEFELSFASDGSADDDIASYLAFTYDKFAGQYNHAASEFIAISDNSVSGNSSATANTQTFTFTDKVRMNGNVSVYACFVSKNPDGTYNLQKKGIAVKSTTTDGNMYFCSNNNYTTTESNTGSQFQCHYTCSYKRLHEYDTSDFIWSGINNKDKTSGGAIAISYMKYTAPGTSGQYVHFDQFSLSLRNNYIVANTYLLFSKECLTGTGVTTTTEFEPSRFTAISTNKVPSANYGKVFTFAFDSDSYLDGGATYYVYMGTKQGNGNFCLQIYGLYINHLRPINTGFASSSSLETAAATTNNAWQAIYYSSKCTFADQKVTVNVKEAGTTIRTKTLYSNTDINLATALNVPSVYTVSPASITHAEGSSSQDVTITAPFLPSSAPATETYKVYFMKLNSKYAGGANGKTLSATTDMSTNDRWTMGGNYYDGYTFYNIGQANYLSVSNSDNSQGTFVAEGSASKFIASTNSTGLSLRLFGSLHCCLNDHGGSNVLSTWKDASAPAGSGSCVIIEDPLVSLYADFYTLYNDLNLRTGSAVGQYHHDSYTQDDIDGALSASETAYTDKNATDFIASFITLRTIRSGWAINEVPTNKFYRFRNGDNYMCNVANGENVRTVTDVADASTIFFLDGDSYLIAYADGYGFNYGYCKATTPGIFNSFDFSESATLGKYYIHSNPGTGDATYSNRYITISGSKLDQGPGEWSISKVTSLPVTITAAKYATLCAPVALEIPSGVKAYYISNVTKTEAILTKLTGTIPADMPVILYADGLTETTTFNFPITTADAFDGTNKLSGQATAQSVAAGVAYTLQTASNEDLTVGFYPKAAGTIAGFRAYLLASQLPADVKGLKFRFDDADGISTIQGSELMVNDPEIYNIAGQRISKLQKGVNIVNGKKVLVK